MTKLVKSFLTFTFSYNDKQPHFIKGLTFYGKGGEPSPRAPSWFTSLGYLKSFNALKAKYQNIPF